MKNVIRTSVAVLALLVSTSSFALGDCRDGSFGLFCKKQPPTNPGGNTGGGTGGGNGGGTGGDPKGTPVAAPEIDVSTGAMGIAAVVAGVLLVGEGLRRRRRR
jgi:hypothetical protein